MSRFFSKLTLNKSLQLKHAVVAWTIAALVINPAIAQQQSATIIKQQHARAIAEKMSVDRQASTQLAIQLADSETELKEAMNGTTVIYIATPSAKGVSKNNWNEFNVGEEGIIFNNSKGPVLTQLGGWSDGNRRLAGGEAAIILNQVNGSNRSSLLGQIEIAGKSAEFILANTNGITCNGCGFINTPSVSLITGQSRFNQNGDLIFDISGGDFLLEGAGLNASNISRFDIVSHYAKINAELYANELNLITGQNEFNYTNKQLTANNDNANANLQFAFDSTALGGMYANRIRLVGTEKGLGVNLEGIVQSTDELQISADGNIELKQTQANNKIQLTSTSGDVTNRGTLYSADIDINASTINNEGLLASANKLQLTGKTIIQAGNLYAGLTNQNQLNTTGSLVINAEDTFENQNTSYVGGLLTINAPSIDNSGTWVLQTQEELNLNQILNSGSIHFNNETARIQSAQLTNTGDIQHLGSGLFTLDIQNNFVNQSGLLATNGDLKFTGNNLFNVDGEIFANAADMNVALLDNSAGAIEFGSLNLTATQVDNQAGRLILTDNTASQQFRIDEQLNNQSGVVYVAGETVSLSAQDLNNQQGNFIINNNSTAGITLDSINNQSGFLQSADVSITTNLFNNTQGKWLSEKNQSSIDNLINDRGFIQGTGFELTGDNFDNQAGVLLNIEETQPVNMVLNFSALSNIDEGVIRNLNGNINITTGLLNNTGVIDATNNLELNLDQLINEGSLQAKQQMQINADAVDNQSGYIYSNLIFADVTDGWNNTSGYVETNDLTLHATTLDNQQGFLLSNGNTTLQVSNNLSNQFGVIATTGETAEKFSITANNLDNAGEIISNASNASITLTDKFINTGIIESSESLNINASTITNTAGSISAADLTLSADVINNQSSIIDDELQQGQIAANQITFTANEFTNAIVSLVYAGKLTTSDQTTALITNDGDLVVDHIELRGSQFTNSGRILSATNDNDSLVLDFLTSVTNTGQVSRNHDWSITTNQFINNGRIEALGSGTLTANTIINTDLQKQIANDSTVDINNKGFISASELVISTTDLDNRFGVLIGDLSPPPNLPLGKGEGLVLSSFENSDIQVNNQSGFIQSGSTDWMLNNIQLINTNGTLWHSGSGNAEFNLLGNLDNTQGSIISEGNLQIRLQDANSVLTNNAGLIQSNDLNIFTNQSIDNINAGALASNNIYLTTNSINNNGGIIEANAADNAVLDLQATYINNKQDGEIRSAARDWNLSLSNLDNDGGNIIHTGTGQLSIATENEFINNGTLFSSGKLLLDLDSLVNNQHIQANNLSILTQHNFNNSGDILANTLELNAESVDQEFINTGLLQANQFTLTNTYLVNETAGRIIGVGDDANFSFNTSQITNNGIWVNAAIDWNLQNIIGNGQFIHNGTGLFSLGFNQNNPLAGTTYFHTNGSADLTGTIRGGISTIDGKEQRTTIFAEKNISLGNNLTNQGAWINTNQNLIIEGNLRNEIGSRLVAVGDLTSSSVNPINFTNQGDIQANSFALTVDQLINSGSLIASGNGNIINSISATALNNTDGLIAAEESRLLINSDTIANQQTAAAINRARGIYTNQLNVNANTLNNTSGVISINSIAASSYQNLVNVNDLNNNSGTIQLSHFEQNPVLLDSLTITANNRINNQGGKIHLLNLIENPAPNESNPAESINAAAENKLQIQTAALNNTAGNITSDGKLIIYSQHADNTKTQLTNAGLLQAMDDLTINAAGLNNSDRLIGGDNSTVQLNLDGSTLTNSNLIFSKNDIAINADQLQNQKNIGALQVNIHTQHISQLGTIDAVLLSLNVNSDLTIDSGESLVGSNALSINTTGDITNFGTISTNNHLLLTANNLTNEVSGEIISGVGFITEDEEGTYLSASKFSIDNSFSNKGLISSQGDLEINALGISNTGRIVTGAYVYEGSEYGGNLRFDLNPLDNFNSGAFFNEGVIYSRGNLAITDAVSVLNRNRAVLMAQGDINISANELINFESRIESQGNLYLNLASSLINESAVPEFDVSYPYGSVPTMFDDWYSTHGNRLGYDPTGSYVLEYREETPQPSQNQSIITGQNITINADDSVINRYSKIFATQNLDINGGGLANNPGNKTLFTTKIYVDISYSSCRSGDVSPVTGFVCSMDASDGYGEMRVYTQNEKPRVFDYKPAEAYGFIHAGGNITGNLQNEFKNGSDTIETSTCDPSVTNAFCATSAPQTTGPIDNEFEEAVNALANNDAANYFEISERDDDNTTPVDPKTLEDITTNSTADGSGAGEQNSTFAGETGEQADATEIELLDDAEDTSNTLTENIPEAIAKATEQELKVNQWPLISFTVLPFNFDLNNLSGLYVVSKNPNSNYLIETRPEFTLYENFLGSDYLLKELGYDADKTIKRLGDAFFENMLMRDALIKETNSRYIADITNDYDTMKMLMDNAVATASNLQLTIGVALTAEQCASLTQDMMWLVKKKINGEDVLVPHLYLTSVSPDKIAASKAAIGANGSIALTAKSIDNQNSMYAGNNLSLTADLLKNTSSLGAGGNLLLATRGDLQQDGRLFAQGDVRLLAAGSISNNGSINGNNVVAIAQNMLSNSKAGSINAEQQVLLQSTQDSIYNTGKVSGANVTLDAGRDIHLNGNRLSASNNIALLAKQDVVLHAEKAETKTNTKKIKANTVQYTSINLNAGGNVLMDAGRDIQLEGADINAGGDVGLYAGRDVNLQAMKNEDNYQFKATRKKIIHNNTTHDVVNISTEGNLVIDAARDANLIGTNLSVDGNASVHAERDTNATAVLDSNYDYSYRKKNRSFGRSKTRISESLNETVVGGNWDIGGSLLANVHIDEAGNVITDESGKLNLVGLDINVGASALLNGDEGINTVGIQHDELHYSRTKKSGVGGFSKKDKGEAAASKLVKFSSITTGGDLALYSMNDANLSGTDISTDGDFNVDGVIGKLSIVPGEESRQSQSWNKSSGWFTNASVYAKGNSEQTQFEVTGVRPIVDVKGEFVGTVGSLDIGGATIIADKGVNVIASTGDVNLTVYDNQYISTQLNENLKVGFGDLVEHASRPDQWIEDKDGRASLKMANANYDKFDTKTTQVEHQGNEFISKDGDIKFQSLSGKVNAEGNDYTAKEDGGGVLLWGALGASNTGSSIKTETQTESTHGAAEVSGVVQHQAVEVVKAAEALDDAQEAYEQARREKRLYERNLDQLQTQLKQLESDLSDKKPGITLGDVNELRELIKDLKRDEDYYDTGIALAAVNVTSSTTALAQQTAAAVASVATWGFNAGVQLDVDASKTKTTEKSVVTKPSIVKASYFDVIGGTKDENGNMLTRADVNLQGTQFIATKGENSDIKTRFTLEGNNAFLQSQEGLYETKTNNQHGHLTGQFTVYGSAGGASINGSYDQNQTATRSTTHHNSIFKADEVILDLEGDLHLEGATIRAYEHLDGYVGGDLYVESQQDRINTRSYGFGVSGGVGYGDDGQENSGNAFTKNIQGTDDIGSANGVNVGFSRNNGLTLSRQTVLTSITSGGTADLIVKGTTYNTAGLIATTDENGKDLGKLNFETGDYVSADLRNIYQNNQNSIGVSTNFGIGDQNSNPRSTQNTAKDTQGNSLIRGSSNVHYSNTNENFASKSLATLGHGNITVNGKLLEQNGELTETGKAEGSPLLNINRNTEATEITLWDSSQSQTVNATVDHRLLTSGGWNDIAQNVEDTKEGVSAAVEKIKTEFKIITTNLPSDKKYLGPLMEDHLDEIIRQDGDTAVFMEILNSPGYREFANNLLEIKKAYDEEGYAIFNDLNLTPSGEFITPDGKTLKAHDISDSVRTKLLNNLTAANAYINSLPTEEAGVVMMSVSIITGGPLKTLAQTGKDIALDYVSADAKEEFNNVVKNAIGAVFYSTDINTYTLLSDEERYAQLKTAYDKSVLLSDKYGEDAFTPEEKQYLEFLGNYINNPVAQSSREDMKQGAGGIDLATLIVIGAGAALLTSGKKEGEDDDNSTGNGGGNNGGGGGSNSPNSNTNNNSINNGGYTKTVNVNAGSKNNWDKSTNGKLDAQTKYQLSNGHAYTTDADGRVAKVEGQLSLNKMDRNGYQQCEMGKCGNPGDEGGHLIASSLGGAGDKINILPQERTLNRSDWKKMENQLRDELKQGKTVTITIDVGYPPNGGVRPDTFLVTAIIDGKIKTFPFSQ